MRIASILLLTAISIVVSVPEAIAANKAQVVCSNTKGAIVVRIGRCKKGETKLSLASLATSAVSLAQIASIQGSQGPQGPQGPKGDTGAVGATGNPAGFDVALCKSKGLFVPPTDPTGDLTKQLSCDLASNGKQDFMLSSAFTTLPPSNSTKPTIVSKQLIFDSTNTYPVGVIYTSRQTILISGVGHQLGVSIVCCPR